LFDFHGSKSNDKGLMLSARQMRAAVKRVAAAKRVQVIEPDSGPPESQF
jgi:hypothetical protein